jgi:20S proteasome subunit beta 1
MAATYNGGVVMGADSRTSTGNYIANRVTDKITPLADKVYICRSGSAADTQNLSRYVTWSLEQHSMELGTDPEVLTAAQLARQMAYQNKVEAQVLLLLFPFFSLQKNTPKCTYNIRDKTIRKHDCRTCCKPG